MTVLGRGAAFGRAIWPPRCRLLSREHAPAVAHFAGYSTRTYTHTQLQAQLDEIRKHNERAGCGTRRAVLNTVLVQLADIDMNLRIGPAERRKLLRLLSNMTGLNPSGWGIDIVDAPLSGAWHVLWGPTGTPWGRAEGCNM